MALAVNVSFGASSSIAEWQLMAVARRERTGCVSLLPVTSIPHCPLFEMKATVGFVRPAKPELAAAMPERQMACRFRGCGYGRRLTTVEPVFRNIIHTRHRAGSVCAAG